MKKEKLLFYNVYQKFYEMASKSPVFKRFCKKAFCADFSQDGFSDLQQIEFILGMIDLNSDSKVLDIGCGNGKMLKYLQMKTGATITGFDYSEIAIQTAKADANSRCSFHVGVIGEIEYEPDQFDLITSMDTIYFARDMKSFVKQIYVWLKPGASFICGYQEGDVMKRTSNQDTTELALSLITNGVSYNVIDYTRQTYDMLRKKREVILSMKNDFKREELDMWYKIIEGQTRCANIPYEEFRNGNARYIYIVKK